MRESEGSHEGVMRESRGSSECDKRVGEGWGVNGL